MAERFVLHHEGRWFYRFGQLYSDQTPYADGQRMQEAHEAGWYWTDHEADTIEIEKPGRRETVGYTLREGIPSSDVYPDELTPADYQERFDPDDNLDRAAALYEPVTQAQPPYREPVEGPWLRLDGEPPPKDGRTWVAPLPYALAYPGPYRHLFPGHLEGFWKALSGRVEETPGVMVYTSSGQFTVFIKTSWEPPKTRTTKRGRRKVEEPATHTRRLELRPPTVIKGPDRATAARIWDEQIEEWAYKIREAAAQKPCSHCDARGFLWGDES